MGKIIINRETNFYSCVSTFSIYLDDKKIDTLKNGQVKEFVISNGKHEIYVKNILDKSNIIKIFIDEFTTIYIDCKMGILNPKLSIKKEISTESNLDRYQLLDKLNELKKKKVISEEEYEKEKNKIFKTDIEQNVEKDTKDIKKSISIPKNKIECENCHKFNNKKRKYCWLCGKELDNTTKGPIENKEIPSRKKNKTLFIIGIILSIVSGLTCIFGNVGVFFSTISLILGIVILAKGKSKKGIGIIIFSGFTLFVAICISIIVNLTVTTTKVIAEDNVKTQEKKIKTVIDANIPSKYKTEKYNVNFIEQENGKYNVSVLLKNDIFINKFESCDITREIIENLYLNNSGELKKIDKIYFELYVGNNIKYHSTLSSLEFDNKNNVYKYIVLNDENNNTITYDYAKEYENKQLEEKLKKEEEKKKREEEAARRLEEQKKEGANNLIQIKKAYDVNEISANNTYKGKQYVLYGKVCGINESGLFNKILDTIGITIEVKENGEWFYVFCRFPKSEREKLSNLEDGDYLLFKGECISWGNYDNCTVI